jgi:hypothetical protein
VQPSGLTVRVAQVAQVDQEASGNYAAPVVIGGRLHVVDQAGGRILRDDGLGTFSEILTPDDMPAGITPVSQGVLNVAGGTGPDVFVTFTSSTLPSGAPAPRRLPDAAAYGGGSLSYQVVYRYEQASDGSLSAPVPLATLERQRPGHPGGGMLGLPNGDLLLATGDSLGFDRDGLAAPQDRSSHLGKLLVIDRDDGEITVAAQGVRNVQRLAYADAARSRIVFADIGATTAEEINEITVADVTDPAVTENFGWGRNDDGKAREGTFYIDEGRDSGANGPQPVAIEAAPRPEPGFRQPYAEFGHEGRPFVAVSGPVASDSAFDTIVALFGDLPTGEVYATMSPFGATSVPVFRVRLVDETGVPVSLFGLAGGRPDPRFFSLPDGGAGVMLERSASLYRLTEVSRIPVPGAAGLLLSGGLAVAGLRLAARRRPATAVRAGAPSRRGCRA